MAQTLAWNANTESNLAGYRVQYGTVSGSPSTTIDVGRVTSRHFTGLQASVTYYFRVVAYNTQGQTSAPSAQVSYTVPWTPATPSPTLTSVSPTSGPTAGGTTITLTGTNFAAGATVRVGGVAATSVAVASTTRVTARTPVGTAGARDVMITNPDGRSATRAGAFTYTSTSTGTLTATSVSPLSGPTSGGTTITVHGTGFVSGASILIGGTPATGVTFVGATRLTARTPAKTAGGYSVQVRNPNGQTANTPVGFTYPASSATSALTSASASTETLASARGIEGDGASAALMTAEAWSADGEAIDAAAVDAAAPDRDEDGDGLPTYWEARFGLDAASATDDGASGDPDGDGVSNAAEFAAGSHPRGAIRRYPGGVESDRMHTRLAIANAEAHEARVLLTFMRADGTTTRRSVDVPARSRRTVDLSAVPELAGASFSTVLETDGAVALDRLVTLDPAGRSTSVASAIDEPSTTWSLPSASTAAPFELFYLILNPGDADARVEVRYLPSEGGAPIVRSHTIAAHSRSTIWVDREEPSLAAAEVAAEIRSLDGVPIVVERTLYVTDAGSAEPRSAVTQAAAASAQESGGAGGGRASWLLAEGELGGDRAAVTTLSVSSAGAATDVTVTLLFEDGAEASASFPVAAGARFDPPLARTFPTAVGRCFAVLVEAADPSANLVVERDFAWHLDGRPRPAGSADGARQR